MNALIDVPEMVSLATASSAPPPHRLQAEMLAHFDAATCSAEMLPRVPVPPREAVVGEWFK